MRLAGRHAVVTGGATGIGFAIASALLAEGAKVTLLGRGILRLTKAQDRLRRMHGDAAEIKVLRGSVVLAAGVRNDFDDARAMLGPISILVNNAGAAQGAPFAKVTEKLWREMLAVNLDGVFNCCQAALPDLLEDEAGRIVTVASMAGLHGFAYAAPYIAAKHGAVGLTRALAAEFAGTKLRVNAVCPGFVETEMTTQSIANIVAKTGRNAAEARAELERLNPSGRLIAPDEVAAAVLDLVLSERNGEAVEIA